MRTSLEIEAKYDLGDGQPLPDLVGAGGVTDVVVHAQLELTATYFDTPAHSLAADVVSKQRTEPVPP